MPLTYRNPVWPGELADPFVLRWEDWYYAYGTSSSIHTDFPGDKKIFPVLRSRDLATWEPLGGALEPIGPQPSGAYWAPEVAVRDGQFFMYFSVSDASGDERQRLQVAVADRPEGPFTTVRALLPDEDFTIDAHPFQDPHDGRWYLFFAKDFFDERVGTGLAVVPLADDMISVAGSVTTVLRASSDWQIYERNRTIYGKHWDAWHTVEGAFVVPHAGRYYCFYSGGAWHSPNYGVSYGVADQVLGPYHDNSVDGPQVLRATPAVPGPGHNSVVLGPDGKTQFIVYHAWDLANTARHMCIDPLVWTPDGPRCAGPTTSEQTIA